MKFNVAQLGVALLTCASTALAALSTPELQALTRSSKSKAIKINDANYKEILSGKRDHHIVVLLSSEAPTINCALCREFKPDFELVASSWFQDHPNGLSKAELEAVEDDAVAPKNVFFFSSEFMDSKDFFQTFQLNNIPKVFYFPPSESAGTNDYVKEVSEYQFFQGDHKTLIIGWLSALTGHQFNIHIPPDYTKIATNAFITFTVVILLKRFNKQAAQVATSKILWSGLSIIAVLLFTSGYMFNQIRGTPYLRESGGKVEYFVGSQQNQYGVETQILSFVYGLLSLLVILLVKKVPDIKNSSVNLVAVSVVSLGIFVAYSALLSIFGLKGTGYPYKFLNLL